MPPFEKHSRGIAVDTSRLETPSMMGYRFGMSSSGVIGRKLNAVFGVESNVPREMDTVIRELQSKLTGSR